MENKWKENSEKTLELLLETRKYRRNRGFYVSKFIDVIIYYFEKEMEFVNNPDDERQFTEEFLTLYEALAGCGALSWAQKVEDKYGKRIRDSED